MKVIADITVVPIGVGVSLSSYVAACEEVLRAGRLEVTLHANGTNVEGEWSEVMGALERCHQRLHEMGAPRVFTVVKLGTRTDRTQSMRDKLESVQAKLRQAGG